ncbi:hypothetical protein K402DRAFT_398305 [Aulographum hederae CBS 113979]|uniref:Calcineurin-like phosphoesterase domain-containing protein n=1 Tax=Aulographum hederae CBS 113979 TaxID=1176131 RepID=A0A6G1GLG9_9PEZI|nr:hypothetical protein K402DRAFT_398305 [Aulographum hederae CBS 113979]
MLPSLLLFRFFRFLLPPCLLSLVYLYLYPVFHSCGFPSPSSQHASPASCAFDGAGAPLHTSTLPKVAPFRLLTLGDPQLEGDSSLPDTKHAKFPSLGHIWQDVQAGAYRRAWEDSKENTALFFTKGIPSVLESYRKRIDLFGNDFYLAHIYRSVHWYSNPTHVTILGDLLGSQWITNEEFARRSDRFWSRVVVGGEKVPEAIMNSSTSEILGVEKSWKNRIINIAGNHDVGYAGDMDDDRVARFETAFGKANWDIKFTLPIANETATEQEGHEDIQPVAPPTLRLVNLNSLNLDTPAFSTDLQLKTYTFLNDIITSAQDVEDRTQAIVLLTHIPLHKENGTCADGPFFDFFPSWTGLNVLAGGVKEQNHISSDVSSSGILQGIFGLSGNPAAPGGGRGRNGIILTGHDHVGCDVYHHIKIPTISEMEIGQENEEQTQPSWNATRWGAASSLVDDPNVNGVREVTVRSMMGDFEGNAAFVSGWFDETIGEKGEWRFEVNTCALGVQHIWWAVHIGVLLVVAVLIASIVTFILEERYVQNRRIGKAVDISPSKEKVRANSEVKKGVDKRDKEVVARRT